MKRNFLHYFTLFFLCFSVGAFAQSECRYGKTSSFAKAGNPTAADIALMNQYDIHYVKLDLAIQHNSVYIAGNAELHMKAVAPLSEIRLQLHSDFIIDSIFVNDTLTTFSRALHFVTIQTLVPRTTNEQFHTKIYYRGTAPNTGDGAIGNGFSNNALNKVTWSLSEPYSAYEWWPSKQVLTDKYDSSDVWITTDSLNKAGSNGVLVNQVALPNGKTRYEWKSRYPIAYYLIAVTVCPFEEYNLYAHPAGMDSILIQNYLFKNNPPEIKEAIDFTPALIELFSEKFGPYPFANEKYGHTQAVFGGAMEHQTMSTMGAINFEIVAHELGHQWFGDYVTCASWSQIWLNEGFATYTEYVANEALMPPVENRYWLENLMSLAKSSKGTVFVNDSFAAASIFNYQSTYKKGGALLHMLRYEFNNDSLFFLGIRNYLQAYRFNVASVSDFAHIMSQTLGKNLEPFFNQWYYNIGYPYFTAKWNQLGNRFLVYLKQEPVIGSTVFKTTLDLQLKYTDGSDTIIRVSIDSATHMMEWNNGLKPISSIKLDPNFNLLIDVLSIVKDPLFNSIKSTGPVFDRLLIYPNPATDFVNVTNASGSRFEILDLTGKIIKQGLIDNDNTSISLHDISNGIYLMRLSKDGQLSQTKLMK